MNNRRAILKSTGIVSSLTMLSRVLGLVRDVFMAGLFGTSTAMSAFVIAFTIPNLFRRLFGEGALAASFIPVFMERRVQQGDAAAWKLAQRVLFITTTLLVILCSVIWISISFLRTTAVDEQSLLTLSLMRIMLPYMIFICLAGLCMAILNSYKHFALPAATPCILNLIWIVAAAWVAPYLVPGANKIYVIAWSIVLAGIFQLLIQWPVLRMHGFRFGLTRPLFDIQTRRVLTLMGPAALGLAVTQINVLVDRGLAAWIGPWAPASLFYSERILYLPLGIFATALGTVLLPTFSANTAEKKYDEMLGTIHQSLRMLLFVMTPAAMGLILFAHPVIEIIYQWKAFDQRSTQLASLALQCYAPGLLVFSLAKIFTPAFYALKDTTTPFKAGLFCLALNVVLNITFIWLLPPYKEHAGIALGTVASESVYAVILAVCLHRKLGSPHWIQIGRAFIRHLFAALVMGVIAIVLFHALMNTIPMSWMIYAKLKQIILLLISITIGGVFYVACTLLLRCSEVTELIKIVRK